jgi:hypothetical protein
MIRFIVSLQENFSSKDPKVIARTLEQTETLLKSHITIEGATFEEWIQTCSIQQVTELLSAILGQTGETQDGKPFPDVDRLGD